MTLTTPPQAYPGHRPQQPYHTYHFFEDAPKQLRQPWRAIWYAGASIAFVFAALTAVALVFLSTFALPLCGVTAFLVGVLVVSVWPLHERLVAKDLAAYQAQVADWIGAVRAWEDAVRCWILDVYGTSVTSRGAAMLADGHQVVADTPLGSRLVQLHATGDGSKVLFVVGNTMPLAARPRTDRGMGSTAELPGCA